MITGSTLAQAKQIVDQGVKGDASYPLHPVLLAKTSTGCEISDTRLLITPCLIFGSAAIISWHARTWVLCSGPERAARISNRPCEYGIVTKHLFTGVNC